MSIQASHHRRRCIVPSPSHRTSRLPDPADLRTTTPHMQPFPSPSDLTVHSIPGTAALSTPRRSSTSSIPRAHDMDQYHQHHHDGRRRSQSTTLQRIATRLRRLTRTSDVPAVLEEDWSVFGEAMAHEVVQPQPQPHQTRTPSPSSPSGVVHTSHTVMPTTPVGEASYTSARRTQSPVSDAHIEDYLLPPVEEREVEVGERRREMMEGEQDEEERSCLDTGLLASHSHVDSDTESTSLMSQTRKDVGQQQDQSLRGGGKGRSLWCKWLWHLPTLPTIYRNILKCILAYFLGSLFTYYPPLSRFIVGLTQDRHILRHGTRFRVLHLPRDYVHLLGAGAARWMGMARGRACAHLDWCWNVDGCVVQTLDSKADVQPGSDTTILCVFPAFLLIPDDRACSG